ncbi:growth hormone receptor a [Poecilia reticulata]|uniref:growth hormone receptor a n=1 Tax=Poecilia reticulata TaxID=8081 RepID=UPI0004A3BB56|nr:PREDICTED: growth hormone receptor-like [Poecilia reticulata]
MAVLLSSNLCLILLVSALDWLPTPASAFLIDWDRTTSSATLGPHFTDCISRDQETFRCWWSPGSLRNLSSPGALRVFYLKKDSPTSEWKECPEYIHENRECFFDANHTSVWIPYCVQLRGQNVTYFNEDDCFTVENIVRPDPPVSLNWTLLNISPSGLNYDVLVSWKPPPSADVGVGWMRIEYEIQYRERNATNWEALEKQPHTQQTIYGLQIGKEYEVHIRSRMQAFVKFGEFSDSIFIEVTEIPSKDSTVPLTLVLIFGVVGVLTVIMLIVISQQQRIMMILLPPVPAPKIKGIDSELLKKGKLEELNFILNGGGVDGLPAYATDFYQEEPWVEFIEVDEDDAEGGDKEDNYNSDTQRLLGLPHRNIEGFSAISHPDDDSGRASCYDTDLPEHDTQRLMASLLPGQPEDNETCLNAPASETGEKPLIQTQIGGPQTWINTDLYAQVSNVMPTGGVVLSPGQQPKIQENTSGSERETQKGGKQNEDVEGIKEQKRNEPQFQLFVVVPEGGGYTVENNTQQTSTPPSTSVPGAGYQTIQPQPMETKPAATGDTNESPYILPEPSQPQLFTPVADYTVVQELDTHRSLLLNPPPSQSPSLCQSQHPLKVPMPVGYVTPDLLGNLSP